MALLPPDTATHLVFPALVLVLVLELELVQEQMERPLAPEP
jgi:hypothetical protein